MSEVTLRRWDGPDAGGQLDVFLPAYAEVYEEPPYCEGLRDVADFVERFGRQVRRDGFRLIVAHDGDEVVGFTFGCLLSPDTPWWSGMLDPLPAEFARETGIRTFAIIELAVRRPWRRRGIAARMHVRLLDGLTVERVTLSPCARNRRPHRHDPRTRHGATGRSAGTARGTKLRCTTPWSSICAESR